MELHDKFKNQELREVIFGYYPEYSNKYDLAIYLRRMVILSATLIRAYYLKRHNPIDNMTSRALDRIVKRPYITIDNAISVLSLVQSAGNELDELGLLDLKIISDENHPDYIDLYEVKRVLYDGNGRLFTTLQCKQVLEKVASCIEFITKFDINNEDGKVFLCFNSDSFDVSDLISYEYVYLYRTVQEVDPLITTFTKL